MIFSDIFWKYNCKVAIEYDGLQISYDELCDKVNYFSKLLLREGVKVGSKILIKSEKCPDLVYFIFAIWNLGATYVPLSYDANHDYETMLINELSPDFIIKISKDSNQIEKVGSHYRKIIDSQLTENLFCNSSHDTAYILFSSGTTGQPKGAKISYKNLNNLCSWIECFFSAEEVSHVVWGASISFDLSILELIVTFLHGGTLYIKQTLLEINQTSDISLSCIFATPTVFDNLNGDKLNTFKLKTIFLGGETLHPAKANKIRNNYNSVRLINAYGPTENTIVSTVYEITDSIQNSRVPIGKPIKGVSYEIWNDSGIEKMEGELILFGENLGSGYTLEKLNNEYFGIKDGKKFFRTGDLVRRNHLDQLEYLGRKDFEIKINGQKANLQGIESIIMKYPSIKDAIVVKNDQNILESYIIVEDGSNLDTNSLRNFLLSYLPSYSVPSKINIVSNFKFNNSGKKIAISSNYIPKYDHNEKLDFKEYLINSLSEMCGIQVKEEDDFFSVGGDSIRGMILIMELNSKFNIDIPINELMRVPNFLTLIENFKKNQYIKDINYTNKVTFRKEIIELLKLNDTQELEDRHYNECFAVRILQDNGYLESLEQKITIFKNLISTIEPTNEGYSYTERKDLIKNIVTKQFFDYKYDYNNFLRNIKTDICYKFHLRTELPIKINILHYKDCIVINFVIHHIAIDELTKLKLFESLFYDGEVLTNISLYPSLKKESFKKENEFWKNYLNKSYSINFSTDFNRNPINNHLGNRVYSKIENFSDILEKKSRYLKVSEFSFLYTITAICFQVIMEDSPLIGIPSNNRNLYKVNPNELGYYVQVVPTIFEFPSNNAFAEVVKSTHDMLQQLLLNQTPDLNDIMKNTRIDDSFTDSICPIMMTYENNSLEHDNLEELMVFNDFSQNDITVLYKKNKNDLQIVIEYNETIYRRSTILAIENMLKTIINNIEANLFANINDINLTTQVQLPQPKNNLHESQIASISELVNKSFEQNSSRIALERGDSFITYEELKNLSDKVMAIIYNIFLNKMDFKQTVLVYCCSDFESIIVIISLLRLGINFCCITKETPKERIKKIVEICQSQYCITMKDEVSAFYSDFNLEVINPSNIDFDYKLASSSFDSHSVREDDLAYTIFTSGSTGEPKAIDISQVSLSYHILSAIQTYDIDYSSKILQISSITFDVAMSDILCSIVSGGSLVLIEESMHYNPRKISEIISKNEITHINCTPTFLKSLNKDDLSNLKIINLGGEVASKSLIEEWRDKVQLFISYGPSECTICTSAVSVNENTHHSTIGYPIGYNKYYVCDKNGRILPSGIPGYLFITGPQLMRGYRGIASGLTHLRFNEEMILAFNTGDIVKLEEDLSYTFIERSGSLTKINGNRISLKEIDYELEKCHNIMNAATIIHKNELCSFIVSDELVNFEEISNSLSLVLPMYMIPQNYFYIEKIPITVSGKVNYKSLQQLIENKEFEVRKLTYTENELMLIWKDILNFEGKILPNTSFYEIGGNSLYYSILINHIFKKWNVMIEIHQIASLRTLSRISNFIDINKITVLETEQDFKGKYNEHIW